jgi:hypothetical protein
LAFLGVDFTDIRYLRHGGTSRSAIRLTLMTVAVSFLALVFTALAMVPGGAHLFSLPNKIDMPQQAYFVAQSIYNGWWRMAFVLIPAMLIDIVFAWLLRGARLHFALAVLGCLCMAATLAVFFTWTYPANVATQNWTVVPDNWQQLRHQWEYAHAAAALLNFAAFCLLALAALLPRRGDG